MLSVYELALRVAPDLMMAHASYEASRARRYQALAYLLPQLSGNGSYGETTEEVEGDLFGLTGLSGRQTFDTTSAALTLTQQIFNRRRWVDADMAKQRTLIADAALEAARNALLLGVADAYFKVLQAEDEHQLAKAEEDAVAEQLKQVRNRFKIGLVARTAVKEAETRQAQAEAELVVAANQQDVRRAELRRLTGQWHLSLARLGDDLKMAPPEPNDRDAWGERARRANADVRAARIAVEVADLNVSRAWGGFWPSLAIEGTARYSETDGGFAGANTQEGTSARLVLNLPIFEGGLTAAEVREANQLLRSAQATLDESLSMTLLQVTTYFLGVTASMRRVEAFAKARESTQSALESTRVGQTLGTRTSADVLTAQEQVFRARRDHAVARYEYILNNLRLKAAAGDIKPADLAAVNQLLK